jgi:16S rRNA (cytosine1402-N4)-methyltransferase
VAEHTPVLPDEVLAGLAVRADGRYCDATFGRGGHTAAILRALGPQGRVIAIDRDPEAIRSGAARFPGEPRLALVKGSFGRLEELVRATGLEGELNGVLMDLGVSSPQLDEAKRGFSFMQDGPLDMRMDNEAGQSAAQWIARADEREIAAVVRTLGEDRYANRIARAIVTARAERAIERTGQLAGIVAAAVPTREPGKHPATRTFQAIRIHVNGELEALEAALPQAVRLLAPGGRLCVISFHSLEDRIVKRYIRREEQGDPVYAGLPDAQVPLHARPRLKRVGKAIEASEAEVARNPRARSAVLRVAERLAA